MRRDVVDAVTLDAIVDVAAIGDGRQLLDERAVALLGRLRGSAARRRSERHVVHHPAVAQEAVVGDRRGLVADPDLVAGGGRACGTRLANRAPAATASLHAESTSSRSSGCTWRLHRSGSSSHSSAVKPSSRSICGLMYDAGAAPGSSGRIPRRRRRPAPARSSPGTWPRSPSAGAARPSSAPARCSSAITAPGHGGHDQALPSADAAKSGAPRLEGSMDAPRTPPLAMPSDEQHGGAQHDQQVVPARRPVAVGTGCDASRLHRRRGIDPSGRRLNPANGRRAGGQAWARSRMRR